MYLMIDNYDSFVYNLVSYFHELGEIVKVVKNDEITVPEIEEMKELKGIIISPGPKNPEDCGVSGEIVRAFTGKIPILGVCLGCQIIGYEHGASIEKGKRPMHGKVTGILHNGRNLFQNLPQRYQVTRYHSLVINENTVPSKLIIDAVAEDGAVMAVSNPANAIYGVQFHPEAVLTQFGHELLKNFIALSEEYGKWRLAV
ncbi:anthranilate synthase component II [Dehalobacterium formicoaceticum]|uniref:anthranilate synthase component II n=1 Tax=Dehalobacterium formicoaceticum TaxID=51515 RepID=UPI000B8003DF|nr:aminodeoxychorismate/anthranilate synthase component II [Dehalobacterium formicoaceticum]